MECFNLFDSQYNVKAFMVALCKQYFSSVSGNDEGKLEELFETLEINDLDKKRNREWQVGFVRQEWESNFSNYSLQGEELYMHNEYRDLHIPKDCYEARENLKSSWSELNEKDFKIYWSNINLKVREEKEHFQFWGVECASENVNIDSNKRLVLKLYNPSRSPSRGMLTRRAFLNVYEYILSKFLLEVNAYRALRVGDSDERNLRRVEKNYIPRLYQFGYCEWQEVTQFQGFYLLIEYKDNDTLSLSAPDLFKKSSEFLGKIHVEKFFYSQKDEDAYTIDFGLPSPTRLKDFNSNKIEQDQDVIRLYKACEVEQLAPDVILGGRYSMMPKSKRQRTS
ncbi:uncharacterized protein RJT21DRAFT_118557 [Scheffersomyces amazonensis]|uniref:uncharacterized protein n=1 Tax=Scheffersomyces amazonensis TaxID=1078765 RepID=UPI00315C5373